MRTVTILTSLAVLSMVVLAGCGPAPKDRAAVDDYCQRCAIYVGDYSQHPAPPKADAETQAAMECMEEAGHTQHVADIAATIVRRARSNANLAFNPDANDLDRQFARFVAKEFGSAAPWGTPATVGTVRKWIVANRAKLPTSDLLEAELAK